MAHLRATEEAVQRAGGVLKFGDGYFASVVEVSLYATSSPDDVLLLLKEFGDLKKIRLDGPGVTDNSLRYLEAITSLEELEVKASGVTGDGLMHLSNLVNLRRLDLTLSEGVRGSALAQLSGHDNLRTLNLSSTWLGDDELAHLRSLKTTREPGPQFHQRLRRRSDPSGGVPQSHRTEVGHDPSERCWASPPHAMPQSQSRRCH